MTDNEKKFDLYLTVLRFLTYKITSNLQKIFLDVDLSGKKMLLTAFYTDEPSEMEKELLDDIVTDSNAHIPDLFVESRIKLVKEFNEKEKYDFVVFAVYEDPSNN